MFRTNRDKVVMISVMGSVAPPVRRLDYRVSADGEPESDLRAGFRLVEQFPGVIVALCWLQRRASVHPELVHVQW